MLKLHAIIRTMRHIATVSELKGGKHNCLQKIPFSNLWLENVRYVPVVVFAFLFGMLVSIWRKNDYTLLGTQLI
jgi:hypothetical protein